MNKNKIIFSVISVSLLFMGACSKDHYYHSNAIPQSWYNSDNQFSNNNNHKEMSENFEGTEALNKSITQMFAADSESIEEGDQQVQNLLASEMLEPLSKDSSNPINKDNKKPKDWVPWRTEYFMTDLSLTGSGLIGALAFKGTSTVRAYWRKQGPKPDKLDSDFIPSHLQDETLNSEPVILLDESSTPDDMVKQLEPAIQAAVLTGKINDTPVLRKNLLQSAKEFQAVAAIIPDTSDELPWWVSRFRLDFSVDAAGRVEPVGMVGGEVRFRFEWHRIKRLNPGAKKTFVANSNSILSGFVITERHQKMRKSLLEFINATAGDLNAAFENHNKFGFKAHQMRMGIGISVKGNIGLIKGSAGVVGQIYFTRNVDRPKVFPVPVKTMSLGENDTSSSASSVLIIERNPSQANIQFATQNKLMFEANRSEEENGFDEAIYRLDRNKFRKGLEKAAKIGAFFAKRATEAKVKNWKIYELRTAFDASISGGLDLVTIVGSATAQISMFNENF